MKILFVSDPISHLKPKGDSTLALLRETLRRGHEAYWAVASDVEFSEGPSTWSERVDGCPVDGLPQLGTRSFQSLSQMDAVLVRKDPPFDASYVRLCWLLALAEPHVYMMNRPSLLVRYHEKLIPLEGWAQGFLKKEDLIPTHIGNLSGAKRFVEQSKASAVITKPFLGFGGGNVVLSTPEAFSRLSETDPLWGKSLGSADHLVQPYHEEVVRVGDRRVFLLEGEVIAHFVRMPKPGGFISNLAQGGSGISAPLSENEKAVLKRLGAFLKAIGVDLAGADLIGPLVSEVNITSPTGLRSLEALDGRDYSADILSVLEKKVKALRP